MNNPFGASSTTNAPSLNHINNPFDSDPNSARNRFPDLSEASASAFQPPLPSQSPTVWQSQQQNAWDLSPSPYSSQQQQPASFQSTATQPQLSQRRAISPYGALPSPTSNFFAPFPNGGEIGSISGFGGSTSSGVPKFMGMGVASGGPYTAVAPMLETDPSYHGIGGGVGGYDSISPSVGGGLPGGGSVTSPHPLLAKFDPLSTASSSTPSTSFSSNGSMNTAYPPSQGQYGQQQNFLGQSQFVVYGPSTTISSNLAAGMDPGPLHRAPGTQPNTASLTGFGGTLTVLVRTRPHSYGPADHPRQIVQMHRAEMEQWDAYGWRQTLNSLESLRFTWENWRDDLGRGMSDVRAGSKEEAVLNAAQRDALEKLDTITAAYLQMQEVYVSYRQSSDPMSKKRVRECLNAGLRNLPDWP